MWGVGCRVMPLSHMSDKAGWRQGGPPAEKKSEVPYIFDRDVFRAI